MIPKLQRRNPAPPNGQGYNPTGQTIKKVQKFNQDLRYVQGFRTTIPAQSTVTLPISLQAAGKKLLGVTFIPSIKTADISDVQATLSVNNNAVFMNMSAANANPLETQGMIFFPAPQSLFGNDSISVPFTNNSLLPVTILTNIFYVPRTS